jgi:glucan 1,3-beta-glucosidase
MWEIICGQLITWHFCTHTPLFFLPFSRWSTAAMASDARPLSSAISQDTLQVATYTPLPVEDDLSVLPGPRPPFLASASPISPSPRLSAYGDSYAPPTPSDSGMLLKTEQSGEEPVNVQTRTIRRRSPLFWLLIALIVLAILIVVVVVPVYFTVIRSKKSTEAPASSSGAPQPSGSSKPPPPKPSSSIWGGDGSTVRTSNGTTFTYVNKLGGICKFLFLLASIRACIRPGNDS